ncbi:MAG TPA: diguanylate cyclase, partial [Rhodopila sp.]
MDASLPDDTQRPLSRMQGKPLMLIGSLIVLAVAIAVMTGLLVVHLREHALEGAGREVGSLAVVLADQAERAVEAVSLVQTVIDERLRIDGIRTPEAYRNFMSTATMRDELSRRVRPLPQLDAVVISDAAGDVINSSRPGYPLYGAINVADRDYFVGLKGHAERSMFISDPVQTRGEGKWTVFIARKITGADGEFLGLIQGALELSYFEQLYQAIAPAESRTSIGLYRQDGRLLVRHPHVDLGEAPRYATSAYFRTLRETAAPAVVVRKAGAFDGEERVIAARSLMAYPMVITVSNTVASILTEWRKQVAYLAGSAVLLEAVIVGAGILMLRQLRGHRMLNEARAAAAEAEAARLGTEVELAIAHERERVDQELGVQNARFAAAVNNMSQALCLFDKSGYLIMANPRLSELFALPAGFIDARLTLDSFLAGADRCGNLQQTDVDSMRSSLQQLLEAGTRTTRIRELADGRILAVSFVPVENDGWLLTLEDVTERRAAAATITHMAHHDALTGLPNRVFFHEKLKEAVARSRRGDACAVLYLDLDDFKGVNDTLGHPTGDVLLQQVAGRLQEQVRETDTVARLGGDEFGIVQLSVHQPHDATALAERLLEVLGVPYELEDQQVMIGTSIGIAIVPADGEDADKIMRNADMALYRAKADGRSRYCFFTPEMDVRMQARRALEIDLRKAVAADQFELFYQPLVNLKTGLVTGFEALMRWFHPRRGMVEPSDFIPLAEEIGLLVPLGEWALRRACFDATSWPAEMKVAVNVSVSQFVSRTLVEDVAAALTASGLDPARLELEITETIMLENTDAVMVILNQIRGLGVGIAMDDFGTGYS